MALKPRVAMKQAASIHRQPFLTQLCLLVDRKPSVSTSTQDLYPLLTICHSKTLPEICRWKYTTRGLRERRVCQGQNVQYNTI